VIRERDPSNDCDNVAAKASDDAELGQVLEAYLADLEAGRPADRERLLAEHPAIARELRACLQVMTLANRMVDASGSASEVRRPVPRLDTTLVLQGQNFLTALGSDCGTISHVHLRDLPGEPEPLIQPRSAEMPAQNGATLGRYQLQGEIARGGMGAILKGRDADLGRDLAIKVLLESHQRNPEVVSRFIEEAQIGGQLQHPGIAPVYELGTFPEPDRRPYFAMKLIKGQTLAALLAERKDRVGRGSPDPALPATEGLHSVPGDLHHFVAIFEQVCQTMAYAHARGVIHRDLKPSNVMVGSFGEVQVMDWGLAKVLPQGGIADEAGAQPARETVVMTVRSGSAGSGVESQAGSVLGTPAYMAPEQARGDLERVDERADVFGLGAILCEILTGRPPFVGSTREEIRGQAARADLTDAHRRLDACVANAELIGLARDSLAADRDRRPRNAGELARRLTAFLAGVQARLRTTELARVEAQARAEEETKRRAVADELVLEARARAEGERKRRRLAVALAGSVLITAGVVGSGWAYLARQRLERTALFNQALGEADALYASAKSVGDDTVRWLTARDATRALERLLPDAPDVSTRRRAAGLVRDATQALASAENDQKLQSRLLDIRGAKADDPDGSVTNAEYAEAFREAGIDVASLTPAEAGAIIADRPSAVRVSLATAIDEWATVRRGIQGDQAGALRLTEIARLADPDRWRNRLRELLQTSASPDRRKRLKDLAGERSREELPAVSLQLLGATLLDTGDSAEAATVLREGQRLHPNDVWLNFTLAQCLERLGRGEEAIRYYVAARSLRPETGHDLAHALEAKGEIDEAIRVFKDQASLRPTENKHFTCLGKILESHGRTKEAKAVLDAAIVLSHKAIRISPGVPGTHNNLGVALSVQGKLDEAIAEYRTALRLKPNSANFHNNLGEALRKQGKLMEAVDEHREALRIKPDDKLAHHGLGEVLQQQGKFVEAIAEYRESLRLKPDDHRAHEDLGEFLQQQGKLAEAIAEYRESLRLDPNCPAAHGKLGRALQGQEKLDDAVAEFREVLRLKTDAHVDLGSALLRQGRLIEAIAELREAVRLKPDDHIAHNNLGIALKDQGKFVEAIAELGEAVRLKPDYALAHNNLGIALRNHGKLDEALAEFRTALRLNPEFVESHSQLGGTLIMKGEVEEAIASCRQAIRLDPNYPAAHTNLGMAFSAEGKQLAAIAEHREALRLKPEDAELRYNLGTTLQVQGDLDEAIAQYRESLRIRRDDYKTHGNLGAALILQGRPAEAIHELREALRLKPDYALTHNNLGRALQDQGELHEAIAEFRSAIRLEPDFAEAHYLLGNTLMRQGELEKASTAFREALRHKPEYAEAHCNLGHVFFRQGRFADALAELKQGHKLGSRDPTWKYPSDAWVRQAERLVEMERKLPLIVSGHDKPADVAESLAYAQMCYNKRIHGASVRLWSDAFQAQPKLADDMNVQNRYNAACAAALAGSAQGKDEPPLDDKAKARWRKQALDWLNADVSAWSKIFESGQPQAKPAISKALQHWKTDTDLFGLRDPSELSKFPEAEQKACRSLWAEVDALLAKCLGSNPKSGN
jgi:eukaryotic-like serine/threonine-protein kinase